MLGKYKASCVLLANADELASEADLFELRGDVKARQAMVFYLMRDLDSCLALYRTVLDTYTERCGPYLRAVALGGVGKALMAQRLFEEALPWLDKALEVVTEHGFMLLYAGIVSEKGVCYTGLGRLGDAIEVHRAADMVLHNLGALQHYQVNLADTGNVYAQMKDFPTAISYYRRALAIAEEINHPASIEKWKFNIRLAYAKLRQTVDESGGR